MNATGVQTDKEETASFSKVYLDYYPIVYSSIYSRIGNNTDAEDLTQEVFIIFYKKIDAAFNARSYIYGIMRNVVLDY